MKICALLVSAGTILLAQVAAAQEVGRCVIDDPTGTPLNVRTAPNGTIMSRLQNGTRVDLLDEASHNGKRWVFVSRQGERLGWVFGAYVFCRDDGDEKEAGPVPPAGQR